MTQADQTFCPHVDQCGGCPMQTMDPKAYEDWKKDLFQMAMGPLLNLTPTYSSVAPNTRIRATLHAGHNPENGQFKIGFYGQKSRDIIDMQSCRILHPRLMALLPWLRTTLKIQRTVDIYLLLSDNGVDLYMPDVDYFPYDHPDVCRLTTKKGSLTKAPVTLTFGNIPVTIAPGGFTQATREGGEEILKSVLSFTQGKKVCDLFTGSGAISLPLAQLGYQVLGIDSDQTAIANLRTAASQYGLPKLSTDVRDLYKYPLTSKELTLFQTIILDPPRPGALAQIKEIGHSSVKRVIYVSCNPESFARDFKVLASQGFALKKVHLIDQFLWTKHLESVALLER